MGRATGNQHATATVGTRRALTAELTDAERVTLASYQKSATQWGKARQGIDFWRAEANRFAELVPDGHVLDIGSGNGRDAQLLTGMGYQVTGIDISAALLGLAREACPQADFLLASAYELPFEDGALDGVWMAASLLHLPKQRAPQAISEVRRVLRPSGGAFIAVKQGDGERLEEGPFGERFFAYYQEGELTGLLAEHNLDVTGVSFHDMPDTSWLCAYALAA